MRRCRPLLLDGTESRTLSQALRAPARGCPKGAGDSEAQGLPVAKPLGAVSSRPFRANSFILRVPRVEPGLSP